MGNIASKSQRNSMVVIIGGRRNNNRAPNIGFHRRKKWRWTDCSRWKLHAAAEELQQTGQFGGGDGEVTVTERPCGIVHDFQRFAAENLDFDIERHY